MEIPRSLERHTLAEKIIRIVSVPILNNIPGSVIQGAMKSTSRDAEEVVSKGGSTHAMDVMYDRPGRKLFSRGVFEGIADSFWHHCISQPKAIRNRLKIVELAVENILREKLAKDGGNVVILNLGGGTSRSIIDVLKKLRNSYSIDGVKVINIDRDPAAIETCRLNVAGEGLMENFTWINDDVFNMGKSVKEGTVDIVEMIGILDYLTDEKVQEILRLIHAVLKPGGTLITANVHPNREMKMLRRMGWPKMYFRTARDFEKVLRSVWPEPKPDVVVEPLRVHNIAILRK